MAVSKFTVILMLLCGLTFSSVAVWARGPVTLHSGKALALDRDKGHCIACHAMPTVREVEQAGDLGPPLIAMSARFPERSRLRALVWDASVANPFTVMPPYGRHRLLTEAEIDRLVEFIHGL